MNWVRRISHRLHFLKLIELAIFQIETLHNDNRYSIIIIIRYDTGITVPAAIKTQFPLMQNSNRIPFRSMNYGIPSDY